MEKTSKQLYEDVVTDVTPVDYWNWIIGGCLFVIGFLFLIPTLLNVFSSMDFSKLIGLLFGHDYAIFKQIALINQDYFLNEALRNSIFLHLFFIMIIYGLLYYAVYYILKRINEITWKDYVLAGFIALLVIALGNLFYIRFEYLEWNNPFGGVGAFLLNFMKVIK